MANSPHKEITVAVLPFQILTDQEGLSPVVGGFAEDLIANFSKFLGLSVISQFSTQHLTDLSQTEAIVQLGADYLVIGSFRSYGDQMRISVQLVRTQDNKVVFAEKHDKPFAAIISAQDTITQQIVSVLQQQIDYDLLSYSYKKSSVQLAAYENWLIGMDYLKKGSLENDEKARRYFEAALEEDAHYARAYSGLSLSYFNEWSCQLWERWEVSQKGAQKYALKALEYDENDYLSLAVLGRTFLYEGKYEKAEHYFRKSIRMNPNDADNLVQVAFSMMFLGLLPEAEQLFQKALILNPFHRDAYFGYGSNIYFELGQFEKSLEMGTKVDITSLWVDFPAYLAAAAYHLSDFQRVAHYWKIYLEQFQEHIYTGTGSLDAEALDWHMRINPYKGDTQLAPFWAYMGGNLPAYQLPVAEPTAAPAAAFLLKGELWELTFQGQTAVVKDGKGHHDLARLLTAPTEEVHCMELMGGGVEDQQGVTVIDQAAKARYQKRIVELQAELKEAEEMSNAERVATLRTEYEALIDHLSQSLGLAGKPREAGSSVEKARSAVTWRIRSAIKKIDKVHPALANHLAKSIKTGTFCAYTPEVPLDWKV